MSVERRRLTPRRWLAHLALLLLVLGVAVVAATTLGIEDVGLSAFRPGTPGHALLVEVRLPRVVLGLVVGAALGLSGATLQGVLRNPLADPYILGVSGGAALGASLVLAADALAGGDGLSASNVATMLGGVPVSLAASLGALGAVATTWAVARSAGRVHPHTLLLSGVVLNAFAGALILFLRVLLTEHSAHELLYWLMGVVGYRSWGEIAGGAVLIGIGAAVVLWYGSRLNLLALGEADASVLGIDPIRTRLVLVVCSALVVGVSVSLAGLVGFVGLMVPHMLRLLVGPDHRLLLPAAAIGGGTFLVLADLLARLSFLVFGTEPPVGAITALFGGPFFLFLMRQRGTY